MGASDWCICNQKEVELWMDVDYEKETTAGTGEEWGGGGSVLSLHSTSGLTHIPASQKAVRQWLSAGQRANPARGGVWLQR